MRDALFIAMCPARYARRPSRLECIAFSRPLRMGSISHIRPSATAPEAKVGAAMAPIAPGTPKQIG